MEYNENYLAHYGIKGMKWGHRKAQRYENKAEIYRSYADDYDPKNYTVKLSDKERNKLQVKQSKFNEKAEKMDVKARIDREGKDDVKKLKAASKLKGHYTDTQGMLRGPYADAVGSIRAQKGERYASEILKKHQREQATKFMVGMTAATAAYVAGMAALIDRL